MTEHFTERSHSLKSFVVILVKLKISSLNSLIYFLVLSLIFDGLKVFLAHLINWKSFHQFKLCESEKEKVEYWKLNWKNWEWFFIRKFRRFWKQQIRFSALCYQLKFVLRCDSSEKLFDSEHLDNNLRKVSAIEFR